MSAKKDITVDASDFNTRGDVSVEKTAYTVTFCGVIFTNVSEDQISHLYYELLDHIE